MRQHEEEALFLRRVIAAERAVVMRSVDVIMHYSFFHGCGSWYTIFVPYHTSLARLAQLAISLSSLAYSDLPLMTFHEA